MRVPLSLRTRLAIWFAASVLLILAPYLAGMLALQWRAMRASLDHHLEEDMEVVLEMLVVRDGAFVWRTDAVRDLGYDHGERRWVEVYGDAGQPYFFRGRPEDAAVRAALPAPSALADGITSTSTPAGAGVRVLQVRREIGERDVHVRVARSEDGLYESLRWIVVLLVISVPLAVLFAAMAGYVISGYALSPLARMAARARTISADRLSERLPVEAPADELGQLAVVFNETFTRLEQSFERLKRFTADASHELRTPLTALRSVGEVVLRDPQPAPAYREAIGSMLEETDRLSQLLDALLTLSRWESGRVPLVASRVDLGAVATEVASQLAVLAEEREVAVTVAIEAPLPVSGDETMLRQALMNVVDNAIKFAPVGGRVRLTGWSDDVACHVAVDDDGPGIPSAQRAFVRERFYRIDDERTRTTRGAGLGLAIVEWALTAHDGRLDILDSPLGGARLVLTLPRAGVQAAS
ncbi:MAG: ATP-binding protein [Vicinamibacterales bacterium]|nr:ATP-binding protein [Vicinamibacterales bacterium]